MLKVTVGDLKMMLVSVAFLLLISRVSAQTVDIAPSPLIGVEGSNLTVDCSLVGEGTTVFELTVDGTDVTTLAKFVGASVTPTGTRFVYGPLERSDSGKGFRCDDGGSRATATLVVHWPPTVSPDSRTVSLMEGSSSSFMYMVDLGNPPSNQTVVGPGQLPFTTTRVLFNATEVRINDVSRDENGIYAATWRNGVGEAVFTLDLRVTAERGPGSLPLNNCTNESTSVTVIGDIPGIEFPNPMVDCDNVNGVTVRDGRITVMCGQFDAGATTPIQCTTGNGVITFQVSVVDMTEMKSSISHGALAGIVIASVVVVVLVIVGGGAVTAFLVWHFKCREKK